MVLVDMDSYMSFKVLSHTFNDSTIVCHWMKPASWIWSIRNFVLATGVSWDQLLYNSGRHKTQIVVAYNSSCSLFCPINLLTVRKEALLIFVYNLFNTCAWILLYHPPNRNLHAIMSTKQISHIATSAESASLEDDDSVSVFYCYFGTSLVLTPLLSDFESIPYRAFSSILLNNFI